MTVVGVLVFGTCQEAGHPILAWHLTGLVALLGGIWAAYDEKVNGAEDE